MYLLLLGFSFFSFVVAISMGSLIGSHGVFYIAISCLFFCVLILILIEDYYYKLVGYFHLPIVYICIFVILRYVLCLIIFTYCGTVIDVNTIKSAGACLNEHTDVSVTKVCWNISYRPPHTESRSTMFNTIICNFHKMYLENSINIFKQGRRGFQQILHSIDGNVVYSTSMSFDYTIVQRRECIFNALHDMGKSIKDLESVVSEPSIFPHYLKLLMIYDQKIGIPQLPRSKFYLLEADEIGRYIQFLEESSSDPDIRTSIIEKDGIEPYEIDTSNKQKTYERYVVKEYIEHRRVANIGYVKTKTSRTKCSVELLEELPS